MKLIKPSYEIIEQQPGLEGIYEQIELAGRTCYKSEPKYNYYHSKDYNGVIVTVEIPPMYDGENALKHAEEEYLKGNKSYTRKSTTAKEFVDRMIKSNHTAMLEHGTVYLAIPSINEEDGYKYEDNPYCKVNFSFTKNTQFITTNYRVLVENGWLDDLKYMFEPTEFHEKRVTVKFICDRGVSHEFVRHRVFSFAQESTRYCNYSKDKFDNKLTFIEPLWLQKSDDAAKSDFINALNVSEGVYRMLLSYKWTPQQARAVLPNSLKTELVMTGFVSDWEHFFTLRDDSHAHPQAQELAKPLHKDFQSKEYIK